MMEIKIVKYRKELQAEWSNCIARSKNYHLFFERKYMEYHEDRFEDLSCMCYLGDDLVAVLPASKDGKNVVSHGGLTFGGLIYLPSLKILELTQVFIALAKYYKQEGFVKLLYKKMPSFYSSHDFEEDEWVIHQLKGKLIRSDLGFVIDMRHPQKLQKRRLRSLKKGLKSGFKVEHNDEKFNQYWEEILIPLLQNVYGTKPTHSIAEIENLHNQFPDRIKLYTVSNENNEMLAGTVVIEVGSTAHTQYIGASMNGKNSGAQDVLYDYLVNQHYKGFKYFSFGTANGTDNFGIQAGLVDWKEGLGARAYTHKFYEIHFDKLVVCEK